MAKLNDVATDVLMKELRKRTSKVAKLQANRAKYVTKLEAIDKEIASLGEAATAKKRGRPAGKRGRPAKATKVVAKAAKRGRPAKATKVAGKRRGRPLGSKNKPKEVAPAAVETQPTAPAPAAEQSAPATPAAQ
jgi:hypothetical protein